MPTLVVFGLGPEERPEPTQKIEDLQTLESAFRTVEIEIPPVLQTNTELRKTVDDIWTSLSAHFQQSWWYPDLGRAVVSHFARFAVNIDQGTISDRDLKSLEQYLAKDPDLNAAVVMQGALSFFYLFNFTAANSDRGRAVDLIADLCVPSDSGVSRQMASHLLDGLAASSAIHKQTTGSFNLIVAVGRALHSVDAPGLLISNTSILPYLAVLNINEFMVEGFKRQIVGATQPEPILDATRQIIAYQSAKRILSSTSLDTLQMYREATGGMPMGLWQNGTRTAHGIRLTKNMAALFDSFEGFSADTFMARRLPVQFGRSLYDRFGCDVGAVRLLHQTDRDGFPGPGLIVDGLDLSKALRAHYKPGTKDPLSVYREIWGSTAAVLHHLPESRFFISRGMLAITGPQSSMYELQPVRGKPPVQYSLVILNVNHGNESNEVAFLVPSSVLNQKFANTAVQVHPAIDIPDPLRNINEAGIRISELRKAAHAMGYPLIAVGSPAVASGSYEYAVDREFVREPLPLERMREDRDYQHIVAYEFGPEIPSSQTLYGHSVPPAVPDVWLHRMERKELRPTLLHTEISHLTERLTELWQGMRYIRANWSKGNTGTATPVNVDFTQEQFDKALQKENLPAYWNGNCVRMLVEAYDWNGACKTKRTENPESFPVLVAASAQQFSGRPNLNSILLDTYSDHRLPGNGMTFRDKNGDIHNLNSPTRGRGVADAVFFVKHVLQHCTSDAIELRFVDRRMVGWNGSIHFNHLENI